MPAKDSAPRSSTRRWTGRALLAITTAAASMLVGGAPVASFAAVTAHSSTTCGGTIASPGSLPGGAYTDLVITGVCAVDAGQVLVTDNVTVDAGAALLAGYALNHSGPGTSGITVEGSIVVDNGATLILGCKATSFPCFDDPHQNAATLNSPATVDGDVIGLAPLGLVVHGSTVRGDILQQGGGGGPSCAVYGLFGSFPFPSPVYSNYEDDTIGGNLRVTGMTSCWFGALRDQIGGSAAFAGNTFSDPDSVGELGQPGQRQPVVLRQLARRPVRGLGQPPERRCRLRDGSVRLRRHVAESPGTAPADCGAVVDTVGILARRRGRRGVQLRCPVPRRVGRRWTARVADHRHRSRARRERIQPRRRERHRVLDRAELAPVLQHEPPSVGPQQAHRRDRGRSRW